MKKHKSFSLKIEKKIHFIFWYITYLRLRVHVYIAYLNLHYSR